MTRAINVTVRGELKWSGAKLNSQGRKETARGEMKRLEVGRRLVSLGIGGGAAMVPLQLSLC